MRVFEINDHGLEELQSPNIPDLLNQETPNPIWIDMIGPSPEDIQLMRDVFKFHMLAIEDTVNKRQRPKIEDYGNHFFLILNPASLKQQELDIRELDVFFGRNFIVTVHQNDEHIIDKVMTTCRNRWSARKRLSLGVVLYSLVDQVVDLYFPILDMLEDEIDNIGEEVVKVPNQVYLRRLLEIKRSLAEMWRITTQQRDAVNLLSREDQELIKDDSLRYFLRDVYDHIIRLSDTINILRDTLLSTVDLYFSSQSNRLNVVVQRLTFITIGIGVLTVISGFYGMNFLDTWPPFGSPYGVLFVLLIMGIGILTVLYFARRTEK
ncbi:MAG: magnesium and cobalt transport protein CorA [Chloroflexi bacterium OLB15]|nr:MAG: magnesium and cobalt transport protein CorA [Chloroflexi bacterium OLB15]